MNATMNTFPPFQAMGSPRGWILAVIALLHIGFFYVLSAGLVPTIFPSKDIRTDMVVLTPEEPITDPEPTRTVDVSPLPTLYVPAPDPIPLPPDEPQSAPRVPVIDTPPISPAARPEPLPSTPVMIRPEIDPKRPLTEPMYPPRAIREEWVGTVLLSVYVMENGRVGDVRLDQSSGHTELDESALREAKRWRLKPGMRDGVPVPMWKQIPITFQLKEIRR